MDAQDVVLAEVCVHEAAAIIDGAEDDEDLDVELGDLLGREVGVLQSG